GAGEIVILMARAALFSGHTVAVAAAPHVHGVLMTVVSLPREVAMRMAIHAARMAQDRDEGGEQSAISRCSNGRRCVRGFLRADPACDRQRSRQDQNRGTDSEDRKPE